MLTDSEARAIVCDQSSAAAVMPAAREAAAAACLFAGRVSAEARRAWDEVCGRPARSSPRRRAPEDIALWLYTSGTTGLPKAVMHRHRHLRGAERPRPAGDGAHRGRHGAVGLEDVLRVRARELRVPAGVGGSDSWCVNGAPSIPARIQALVTESNPTVLFGVPAFFAGFARLPDAELPASVRPVLEAGEALSVELFETFQDRFGLPLLDGLGSTEALHHVTSNRPDDLVAGSAGRALEGFEVRRSTGTGASRRRRAARASCGSEGPRRSPATGAGRS